MTSPLLRPLEAPDSEGVQPGVITENRKVVLDRLSGDHAIERIGMPSLKARRPQHGLWFDWWHDIPKPVLNIEDQIALELDGLRKFAEPHLELIS